MLAIAAAAHALDALYGEVRDLALPEKVAKKWRDNARSGPPRPAKVDEVLKQGFAIGRADRFTDRLETLFTLRDQAVHPDTGFNPPAAHPLGVNTAVEYLLYRCEEASAAVDLLLEVLETCVESPKPPLSGWSADLRASHARLAQKRASLRSPP